jgi:sensory rhodopsin
MVATEIWFGIAVVMFLTAIVTFLGFAFARGDITSPYYFLPPLHALIAGVAYTGMTLVAVGTLGGGPLDIELFRYADWSLSTPIITYYLSMLAGAQTRVRVGAVLANVLMIWAGYASIVFAGPGRWGFFALSMVAFLALLYLYLRTFTRAITDNPDVSKRLFLSLRDLTVIIWALYPVVYLLGPNGFEVLLVADHHFVIVFLDLTAKVGFMTLMLVRQYQLNMFILPNTTAAAE